MKVLVVGSGGREHALVWKIAKSSMVEKIFCAPGNAGTKNIAENIPINANDIESLADFAKNNLIDLTVVGPEEPLVKGIHNLFKKKGLKLFGPDMQGALLEGSKSFSKTHMLKYNIPTSIGKTFTDLDKAKAYAMHLGFPVVIKADGLAAGKGVIICQNQKEAYNAIDSMLIEKKFGEAGSKIVVEECLKGEEASFIVFTDGKTILPLPESQDHKRIFDNDEGPNTGGMGAYSPAPVMDYILKKKAMDQVMIPAIKGMAKEGHPFCGVLYAGLMIYKNEIKVLEFNVRLGDPETQPILMRIKNDIVPLMEACVDGTLSQHKIHIDNRSSICVVISSGGYPGSYKKGEIVQGINEAGNIKDTVVFHAGTTISNDNIITNGGRVFGVTALGIDINNAMKKAYNACDKIKFKNSFFRKDIGAKAVKRLDIKPEIYVIMGSDSDFIIMEETLNILKKFGIPYYVTVASAHRTPDKAAMLALEAKEKGVKVIIAGAGHAAHLAGFIAAHTSLPVIGIPIDSSVLKGMDSLLSTVQMPPGIPVATMAIGKSGAINAGIFAAQILSISNNAIADKLAQYKKDMADKIEEKAKNIV